MKEIMKQKAHLKHRKSPTAVDLITRRMLEVTLPLHEQWLIKFISLYEMYQSKHMHNYKQCEYKMAQLILCLIKTN